MKNKWIVNFIKYTNLLKKVVWVLKSIFWVRENWKKIYKKSLSKLKETWNIAKKIISKNWNKVKDETTNYIEELKEELKSCRGGELNRSVLLYQTGSHKYGYEKLGGSKQSYIYWLYRTKQNDEWTDWQITREKLVDRVNQDFNLKRDGKKIKKYFRPFSELERKLKWVNEETKEIMLKNPLHDQSEEQQKRLDELFVDKKRLETELYYSKKFFIIR